MLDLLKEQEESNVATVEWSVEREVENNTWAETIY